MPSHMSSIGFPVQTVSDFTSLARQAVQAGQAFEVTGLGRYRRWSPGAGIELWAQVNEQNEVLGLNPHFAGEARMRVGLVRRVVHPKDTPLDGAFYGWANPQSGVADRGDYPFCFTAPDYRLHADLALPNVVSVQLAAFPNELLAFDNEKEKRSSKTWMKDMAAESCIPSGTFLPGKGPIDPTKPEIMFCGRVRETSALTNPVTGQPFSWARVRTLGGELDVVVDPAAVRGTIRKNGIVGSMCWLSGLLS